MKTNRSQSPSRFAPAQAQIALVKTSCRKAMRNVPEIAGRGSAAMLALFALFGFNPQALAVSTDTWTGATSTDWATASNWVYSTGSGPVATGDSIVFTNTNTQGTAALTDTLTTSTFLLAGITFNAPAISYTMAGNAFELTGNIVDNSTNTETIGNAINLPATHSFSVVSGGSLVLGGDISGAGGVTLNSPGTVTLTAANGYTGITTLSDGTLALNFSASGAPTTNIISASSVLSLGGGTLSVAGSSSSSAQTFASTTLTAGNSVVSASGSATVKLGAITYGVGSILQLNGPAYNNAVTTTAGQAGSGLVSGVGTITTTSGVTNTVLQSGAGGNADYITYATVGLYDWAIDSGATPFSLIGASQGTGGTSGDGAYLIDNGGNLTGGANLTDIIGTAGNHNTTSLGALRFNVPGAGLNLSSTVSVEGMLVTPNVGANNTTIYTSNALQPGQRGSNAGSIAIIQNDTLGIMNFTGIMTDGKTAGGSIVQSGPGTVNYGTLANTYTGATYLDGGVTEIQVDGGLGNATTGATTYVNGGTILGATTFALDSGAGAHARPISLGLVGGGLAALAGDTFTVDGAVFGNGGLVVGIPASSANQSVVGQVPGTGSGTANAQQLATGTVVLTYSNSYYGGTTLDTGTLNINGIYALGGADYGGVTFNGGTLQYATGLTGANGSSDLTSIGTAGVTLASGGGTIDTNGNAVTYAGSIGNGGSGSLTVKTTAVGGSLTLNGNNTFTGGVTLLSGGLTFGGSNVYTGPTAITAGTLTMKTGSSLGNTAITVSNGATVTAALTGNANINLGSTGASLTLSGGSTLLLQAIDTDTLDTLTLNSAAGAGTGPVLTVGGASSAANLTFDIASAGTDELVVNGGMTAFGTYGGKIIITDLDTNTPASSYTLVSDASGGLAAGGYTSGADFWLGTTALTLGSNSYALSLSTSGTSLILNLSLISPYYYWTGGTGSNASWATLANFATDQTGASAQSTALSLTSNVFLTANSAANFTQTLDGSYTINSLTFTGGTTSAGSNSITVGAGTGGSLTINAASSFIDENSVSYPAGTGLVVQAGSAAQAISANVNLGNSQTWFVNNSPSNPLRVSGVIADSVAGSGDALTKSGTGTLILSNAETYDGGTVVTNGTLQLASGASLLATGALTVSGTGTFDLNGNSQAVGSLSDGGVSTGIITSSAGTAVLTLNNSGAATFGGTITDAGTSSNGVSLGLTLNGAGGVVLSGSNSYNGLTTLNAGNLTVGNNYALGNAASATGGLQFTNTVGTSTAYFSTANPNIASLATNGPAAGTSLVVLGNTVGSGTATTLTIGGGGATTVFNGVISDLTGTKSTAIGNLVVDGGVLTLAGADTFTGTTVVSGGTLVIGNALALQNSLVNYAGQGGTLSFGTPTAATFGGLEGSQNLALTNTVGAGGAVALTVGGDNTSTVYTGNLSGAGSLYKLGSGTMQLGSGTAGGASYAGTTVIGQGTLILGGTSSLTGSVDLEGYINGTTSEVTAITIQDNAVINDPTGYFNIASNDGGNANNYPGSSTVLITGTSSVTVGSFNIGNTSRVAGGTSVTVNQLGTLAVTGTFDLLRTEGSTASASTVNLNGGTLAVGAFDFTGGNGTTQTTTIHLNGGTLEALASDPTGSATGSYFLTNNTTGIITDVDSGGAYINTNGFNITIQTNLLHGTGTTDGGLTKSGAGMLTLDGTNTYNGATTITAGTLQVGAGDNAPFATNSGTVSVNGGTLDLNGNNVTINGFKGTSGFVTSGVGGGILSVGQAGTTGTFAGVIEGSAVGFTTRGTGTTVLTGANTYTGATTVGAGTTLELASGGTLGDTAITVNNGATLNAQGTITIGPSGGAGSNISLTLNAGATFSMVDGSIGTVTIQGVSAGTGLTLGGVVGNTTKLDFELGSTGADQLVIANGGVVFSGTDNLVTLSVLGSNAPTTLTNIPLLTVPNGTVTASDFALTTNGVSFGTGSGATTYAATLAVENGDELVLDLTQALQSLFWTGNGTTPGSWSDIGNFTTAINGNTPQTGVISPFSNVFLTANAAPTSGSYTENLDGSYGINSLNFDGTAGAGSATNSVTLAPGSGGGANTLTLEGGQAFTDASGDTYAAGTGLVDESGAAAATISANINLGSTQTWEIDSANALTVSGTIANATSAAGLIKAGSGTLILSAANTYSGGTTINDGEIQLGITNALLSSGALTVTGTGSVAGTLDLAGFSQTVGQLSDGGVAVGTITSSAGTPTFTVNENAPGAFSGSITGSLGLTSSGTSSLTLSGANTYTGLTTVSNGTLIAAGNSALGNSSASTSGLVMSGTGVVDFTSTGPSIGALTGASGNGIVLGNAATPASATTLTITGAGAGSGTTFAGVISDKPSANATAIGNLILSAGSLTLSGANTFSGTTVLNGGTLTIGNALALQDSTVNYDNQGGTLSFGTVTAASLGGLEGSQNLALTNAATTPAAVALTVGAINTAGLYTGTLSGLGSLDKVGTATLQIGSGLTGGATYAGNTVISQGTLVLGGNTSLTGSVDLTGYTGAGVINGQTTGLTVQDDAVIDTTSTLNIVSNDGGNANNYPGASTVLITGNGNVSVGAFNIGDGSRVANGTSVTVNDLGTLAVSGTFDLLRTEGSTASASTVNLNGGTLAVGAFDFTGGNGTTQTTTLHLNGGLLQALANDPTGSPTGSDFINNTTGIVTAVDSGGAYVNTNGFNITIATVLKHGTGTTDGGLTKSGAGSLTLPASSTYNGPTTVNAGALIVSGSLSATSGVTDSGFLEVDGAINGAATVAVNGGTLDGTGSVGAVNVSNSGTLAPGLSSLRPSDAGTLAANGNVSLTSNSTFSIRLGVGVSDQLAVGATDLVSLNGANLQLTLDSDFVAQLTNFIYILINGGTATTGNISGEFAQGTQITDSNGDLYNILYNVNAAGVAGAGNDVALELVSVPEPGTWASLIGGLGILIIWQRSRRRDS